VFLPYFEATGPPLVCLSRPAWKRGHHAPHLFAILENDQGGDGHDAVPAWRAGALGHIEVAHQQAALEFLGQFLQYCPL